MVKSPDIFKHSRTGLQSRWWRQEVDKPHKWYLQYTGIPSRTIVEHRLSKTGILVCRFVTKCPVLPDRPRSLSKESHLSLTSRIHALQWIMKRSGAPSAGVQGLFMFEEDGSFRVQEGVPYLESTIFISTSNYSRLPPGCTSLLVPLVEALRREWARTLQDAEDHLAVMRTYVLESSGRNENIIGCLLDDALVWDRIEKYIERQLHDLKELQLGFKPDPMSRDGWSIFHDIEKRDDTRGNGEESVRRNLTEFEDSVRQLGEYLNDGVEALKNASKELIQLEFNLTSISEAQKSTTMSISMKRLSWITFIFLPLTFVSSLFGMNVDLLESKPPWWIYLPFSMTILGLAMLVWLIFKYNRDLENKIEGSFSRLLRTVGKTDMTSSSVGGLVAVPGDLTKNRSDLD